jgi:formate dehydrogenase subunit gamma
MSDYVIRFSPRQRAEHAAVMTLFLALALTGLPQKYFEASWAVWLIEAMGGIDRVRWWHRAAGLLFAGLTAAHLMTAIYMVMTGRSSLSLVPTRKDFSDAIVTLRYYIGISEEQAQFDRFDYRQKFEYWGLVLGAVVVISTGFVLYFPIHATRILPGEFVPAAKMAHSYEGLMAFLVVIIWHIYNAHLNPDVFPFDKTIFTGKISRERMRHEHPLEYARMLEADQAEEP